jgi:hypothetical protein
VCVREREIERVSERGSERKCVRGRDGARSSEGGRERESERRRESKDMNTVDTCAVNAQPFSESEKAALVEEANLVFRYNIAIFEELEGICVYPQFIHTHSHTHTHTHVLSLTPCACTLLLFLSLSLLVDGCLCVCDTQAIR